MSNTITMEGGNFSTIPNELLNDEKISLTAKGLYVFMRGKPSGWNFTIRSMAKQLKEGETAIGSALNELKKFGWMLYSKKSDGKGVYHLFWSVQAQQSQAVEPKPEYPNQGNPSLGNPMKGKPQRISKKEPIVRSIDSKEDQKLLSGKPDTAKKVIQHLNDKTGRSYKAVPSNTSLINARLKEGATVNDIVAVINRKCAEWLDDPKFSQFLRPSTLFNATKFNDYLGQLNTPLPVNRTPVASSEPDLSWANDLEAY